MNSILQTILLCEAALAGGIVLVTLVVVAFLGAIGAGRELGGRKG